jgi:GT2 family glycosyltransferase
MRLRIAIRGFANWRTVLREFLLAASTGLVSTVVSCAVLGINASTIALRWQTNEADDHIQHYMVAKTITDSPLLGPNSRMGFPTTENLFFAPNWDPASAIVMDVESLLTSSGILILNVYNVIGFFSVGFVSYLFFRGLRVRRWIGIVFALMLSFAPYEYERISFGHAFVANYWAIPLLGILLLMVGGSRTNPFERWITDASTARMAKWRRLLPLLVITVLVSLSLSYYYVFAVIILGGVLATRFIGTLITRGSLRTLLWPLVTVGSLVTFIVAQLGIFSLDFGDRYAKFFAERSPSESEMQAGKITTLLLPWQGTGFTPLAAVTTRYLTKSTISPDAEPPGTPMVAAAAMLLIVIYIVVRVVTVRMDTNTRFGSLFADERLGALAFAFLWGLLFFTVSGLGEIFAFLVSPEIRSWARMGIVLTLVALGFLSVVLDTLARPLTISLPLVATLCLIAVIDQLAGVPGYVHLQPTNDANLRLFVHEAENRLPVNCGVVQLPLKRYPASGNIELMTDYAEALPYVVSTKDSLRWSYGAVLGTKSGDYWQKVKTVEQFKSAVIASKACAIEVDTDAYIDNPQSWKALVRPTVTSSSSFPVMSNQKAVTVVTVSYYSNAYLAGFLTSVAGSTNRPVQSVVVNNAADDTEVESIVAAQASAVLLDAGRNLGYGKAMNLGVASTEGSEWILLANPDLTLAPGTLDELIRVGESDERIGAVGPLLYTPVGEIYPSARRLPSLRHGIGHALLSPIWKRNPFTLAYLADRENPPRERDAGWLSGACILVRRSAFTQIDGFDDKFFMYFEDVDLCARLSRAGWRVVYAPSAVVTHVGGHSTRSQNRAMIKVHHQSAYKYLAARYPGWHLWPLRMVLLVALRLRGYIAKS